MRAYFVEGLPSAKAARRFGYTPGSFRVLCTEFRQQPHRPFFLPPAKGPSAAPKSDPVRERVIALRKQNLSIYDISAQLKDHAQPLSPAAIALMLKAEGFAHLPRRHDEERPARHRPAAAAVADVRQLDLAPRPLRTRFGGLFLFVPYLARIPFDRLIEQAGLPSTRQVPAGASLRALLGLKLFGTARHSHVMSDVFDHGLALFAGLNVTPKRSFLTEYSARIDPRCYPTLMQRWFDAMGRLGLERGLSFDLDFHTIPYHGDDALLEKHYVSKRSRRQKGIPAISLNFAFFRTVLAVSQIFAEQVFRGTNRTVSRGQPFFLSELRGVLDNIRGDHARHRIGSPCALRSTPALSRYCRRWSR